MTCPYTGFQKAMPIPMGEQVAPTVSRLPGHVPRCGAPITDRAEIEALFAADDEADALAALSRPNPFVPTSPDDGDEGAAAD